MVDMTDAAAQAAMKRAIEIDALADLELQAASQLNQSIQTAAPGSAPIIEAQADAWLIRANAYTQSATADLMRLRVDRSRQRQRRHQDGSNEHHQPASGSGQFDAAPVSHK
jgi:hypothetical protein